MFSQPTLNQTPTFTVGSVLVYGDLILSPMDGYSDQPFRSLARSLGSAMSYTEFVNGIDVINGIWLRYQRKLTYMPEERPVVFQLFDDNPDRLIEAALHLRERNPDIIDVNMGCSARDVSGRGAGAGLLRTPDKIARIFSTLSSRLDIPITGKIRLGWDDNSLNYPEVAHIIEDNGGQLIAVHGRTRAQGYNGHANWDAIAEVKQRVKIPVIGNGDVRRVSDIEQIKRQTGCDGVMIARAAIGNPWIFSRLDREQVPLDQVRAVIFDHLRRMQEFYGEADGLVRFRKHASRYISPYPLDREMRIRLLTCTDTQECKRLLNLIIASEYPAEGQQQAKQPGRIEDDETQNAAAQSELVCGQVDENQAFA